MRIHAPLLSLLLLPALACGGGPTTPSFDDPITALETASAALATGEKATAEAGFRYAADQGVAKTKYQGLLGLGKVLAKDDPAGAAAAFERARTECADLYDIAGAQAMLDAWIKAGKLEQGQQLLAAAAAQFPAQKGDLEIQDKALSALASGDTESLAGLGYVGD
ncbi:MAG: hypothetical protein ISR76_00165 [Planctomycetes bacterium]|nr:hypothetical protein [Planctomycetota bacterium]MBL7007384.1 hypothetical protein [Planctomycetota bacterium]